MAINLQTLKKTLAPVKELVCKTSTFTVSGVDLTIRILVPKEESYCQMFAAGIADDEEEERALGSLILDRYKTILVASCIHEIAGEVIPDFVETGEFTEDGTPIRIGKTDALLEIVGEWPAAMTTAIFRKYYELMLLVDKVVADEIAYDPSDIDSELSRLEARKAELEGLKAQLQAKHSNVFSAQVASVLQAEEEREKVPEDMTPEPQAQSKPQPEPQAQSKPQPEPQEDPQEELKRVMAAQAAQAAQAVEAAKTRKPLYPEQAPPPKDTPAPTPFGVGDSSFLDTNDPESMEAEMERERKRLEAQHAQRRVKLERARAEHLKKQQQTRRRRPPHMDATEVAENLDADLANLDDAVLVADNGKTKVFKTPAVPLEPEHKGMVQPKGRQGIPVNPRKVGPTNPRFDPNAVKRRG